MRSIGKIPGALVVWIVSYLFFIFTLVNNLSASHDSIHYLLDILNGKELFHQHHLLYNILASRWRLMMPGVAPQYAIESFTAFWGSSALSVIYVFFKDRFCLPRVVAALGTAIIAFSYGVWFYSVNIEVYMPPLFFIIWTLYFLSKKEITIRDVQKIAVLHSLAILFHQVNVLFIPVVVLVIFANRKKLDVPSALLRYALTGIVLAGGMYFIAGWLIEGHSSLAEWTRWMEGYTVGHGYWQPLSLNTPVRVATGFSHAFIGGHFIFRIPAVEHALQHSLRDHGLTDEIFLASKILHPVAWTLCVASVILFAAIVLLIANFIKNYKTIVLHYRPVIMPVSLTLLIYSLFFCFWMPEILEFWILQMVLVWMLLIGTLPVAPFLFRVPVRPYLSIVATLLFSVNFFGSMYWLQDIRNDWYYQEAARIARNAGPGDLVIIDNEWILKDFVRYYSNATVLATDEPEYSKATEQKMMRDVLLRGGKTFVYCDHQFTRSY